MGLKDWLNKEVVLEERVTVTRGSQIVSIAVICAVLGILRYSDLIRFSWEEDVKNMNQNSHSAKDFWRRMIDSIQKIPKYKDSLVFEEDNKSWLATFRLITKSGKTYSVKCVESPREMCKINPIN